MEVVVERPESMNLLGLFMKSALESRADRLERLRPRGDIGLTAGEMSVTLRFAPERVVVAKGISGEPRARLSGTLESLVQIARGNPRPLLARRARLSGSPLAALPLAWVFRKGG